MSPPLRNKENHKIAFSYVTRRIIWKIYYKSYGSCAWHVVKIWFTYEVSLKYLWRLSSYRAETILWRTDPQIDAMGKNIHAKFWFLCMRRCLNVLYKCMKFRWNTSNGYQVIERTRNSIANDQREITPKYSKQRYCSCAWHIVSCSSRNVWSFNQIALTVFNIQSEQNCI